MQAGALRTYRIHHQGQRVKVAPESCQTAKAMDKNQDGYVSNDEIASYYAMPEKGTHGNNREARVRENKFHLLGTPNPDRTAYRSFAQVEKELKSLAQRYPDLCQLVVLGKTAENRPIYALRVTADAKTDTSHKPGVVITGLHHAREWTSAEVVMHSPAEMLEKAAGGDESYKRRLDQGEFWFVPVVSPDGLEYSRDTDNTWRKNRSPIETMVNGELIREVGVDLNRNYGDSSPLGNLIYRPAGDKPNTWQDDFEWGADAPWSDVYRGEAPGSEAEVDALQRLKLGHKNIRGVLDYHSFGESIVYPFGYSKEDVPHLNLFRAIGQKMNQAAGGQMELKSSAGLYPITGNAVDIEYINGIVGYTMEINDCFQPAPERIKPTCERFHKANMTFIDEILKGTEEGTLPRRILPDRYRSETWNLAG
jgi:Zinc carboxypeptidase